jgi:hypothetical protein
MLSITVREHFYKLVSLKEHLEKDLSLSNFKSSIYQVLHTLDVIQSMYPTFRHNNLTINTVMVYQTNEKILKDRGRELNSDTIELLHNKRIEELSEPEKSQILSKNLTTLSRLTLKQGTELF